MNNLSSFICCDSVNTTFSICISNDYTIYSFGYSECRSHGHKENDINIPTQIKDLTNIKMIDCGNYHTVCLNYDGDVFYFGLNNTGELVINQDYTDAHIPQKININPCKQVSCGDRFIMCLTEDNILYSFGYNYNGQLGLGNNTNYNSPQLISDINNIEYIICGGNYTLCKTYNNEYYSWGYNYYGQLGQATYKSCNKPIQCLNWPDNIIDIKTGYSYSLLLTSEGQVYACGSNSYGQFGINNKNMKAINLPVLIKDIPEIQRMECGENHSMCIDINDNLWVFGKNENGQLGLGDTKNRDKPTLHPILSNIIDISSGGNHTFVKTIDNKIYAFGKNNKSQLGIETSEAKQTIPIQVFGDNEDIWCSRIGKSRAKSARK